ncbi:MAG: restriction endonuclease subunit S [Gaiella sp.]
MVPYLRAANVKDGTLDLSDVKEMNFTPNEQTVFSLESGDVLVTEGAGSLAAVGASAVWNGEVDGTVCFQNTLLRLRPRLGVDSRFLAWWARHAYADQLFASVAAGANIFHLGAERVRELPVWFPDEALQREIADFLDAETARINALIEKKLRLINLIGMRSREAVAQAVFGGLATGSARSTTSMFFGRIPETWSQTQIRHLGCEVQTGPFGSQLHADEYIEGGWPVINPANLAGGVIAPDQLVTVADDKRAELELHVLRAGDVLFGRRGEMGRAALVTPTQAGWLCGTGCLRLRVRNERLLPEYLLLLLRTKALRDYFELASVGSTMDNLSAEIILAAPAILPSAADQRQIVEFAGLAFARSTRLQHLLETQTSLLREHRQALVTAAVTGQLDVAKAAA